ncbi:MAG: hypothetical protein O3B01_23210 [Planctomycetota bacterium]|nr:hypothetical protein [Planctomycetota bacterium]MDA1141481.1 hypothetical protein [Planctomycetota bacterium]
MYCQRAIFRSRSQEKSRGETLVSVICATGIVALTMTLLLSHLSKVREQSRTMFCAQNLKQLAAGMNLYRLQYLQFPNKPLDDFRLLLPFVHDLEAYVCPSTDNKIKDTEDLNWATSYRYFGRRSDLDAQGLCAYGRCCDGDEHYSNAFDPAHPGKSWPEKYRYGAVFDRSYENHGTGCLNIVFLDDNHWERLCSGPSCFDRQLDGLEPADTGSPEESTTEEPASGTVSTTEHVHVHVRSLGDDAAITCNFTSETVYIRSTKDLSNVVLEFKDGSRQKFDGLIGLDGMFLGTGEHLGKQLVGCWVKSGRNASGDGPGYGEYFPSTFVTGR